MPSERSTMKTLALATMFSAVAVFPIASSAGADELISIPVSGVHRGAEGTTVTVASVNVAADLVGQTCQIVGQTVNQRSVHPGNDLLVVTGGRTFVIPDFEDVGDIVHDAGETEAVGETIELIVRFGPDRVSSGGFKVLLTCDGETSEPTVPETTVPETTVPETTVPETTVPVTEGTVDETAPTSSTDPAAPEGPTVSEQPTTAPPVPTTTPAAVASTEVTTPSTSTTAAPPAGPATAQLPVTGSQTWWILATGLGLAGAGLALLRNSRLAVE
jgi:LPXTG-motif cell wall-anchored protein